MPKPEDVANAEKLAAEHGLNLASAFRELMDALSLSPDNHAGLSLPVDANYTLHLDLWTDGYASITLEEQTTLNCTRYHDFFLDDLRKYNEDYDINSNLRRVP